MHDAAVPPAGSGVDDQRARDRLGHDRVAHAAEPAPAPTGRRARERRSPRHAAEQRSASFTAGTDALGELAASGARVSASVVDLATGETLLSIDDTVAMPTASLGKVLLLIELSARMRSRDELTQGLVERSVEDSVGDSGLWQHLQAPVLPTADLAALIGGVSDNLATNVLLRRFGLDAVRARAEELGLRRTALLDRVRDRRGPDDAPQLSIGATGELAGLFAGLARGQVIDSMTSSRVIGWLSLGTDLSMVASAFGLDPLAHRSLDHGIQLINKTGTDVGVRAEAGAVRGPSGAVAYAVAVHFDDESLHARLRVLDAMRAVGTDLLEHVAGR